MIRVIKIRYIKSFLYKFIATILAINLFYFNAYAHICDKILHNHYQGRDYRYEYECQGNDHGTGFATNAAFFEFFKMHWSVQPSKNTTYFKPKIKVRLRDYFYFNWSWMGETCDDESDDTVELGFDGECKVINNNSFRVCARLALPGRHGNISLKVPRVCAYYDPDFWLGADVSDWHRHSMPFHYRRNVSVDWLQNRENQNISRSWYPGVGWIFALAAGLDAILKAMKNPANKKVCFNKAYNFQDMSKVNNPYWHSDNHQDERKEVILPLPHYPIILPPSQYTTNELKTFDWMQSGKNADPNRSNGGLVPWASFPSPYRDDLMGCVPLPLSPSPPPYCPNPPGLMVLQMPDIGKVCSQIYAPPLSLEGYARPGRAILQAADQNSVEVPTVLKPCYMPHSMNAATTVTSDFDNPKVRVTFDNPIPACKASSSSGYYGGGEYGYYGGGKYGYYGHTSASGKSCVDIKGFSNDGNSFDFANYIFNKKGVIQKCGSGTCIDFKDGKTPTDNTIKSHSYFPLLFDANNIVKSFGGSIDDGYHIHGSQSGSADTNYLPWVYNASNPKMPIYGIQGGEFINLDPKINPSSKPVTITDDNGHEQQIYAQIENGNQICAYTLFKGENNFYSLGCVDRARMPLPTVAVCSDGGIKDSAGHYWPNFSSDVASKCLTQNTDTSLIIGLGKGDTFEQQHFKTYGNQKKQKQFFFCQETPCKKHTSGFPFYTRITNENYDKPAGEMNAKFADPKVPGYDGQLVFKKEGRKKVKYVRGGKYICAEGFQTDKMVIAKNAISIKKGVLPSTASQNRLDRMTPGPTQKIISLQDLSSDIYSYSNNSNYSHLFDNPLTPTASLKKGYSGRSPNPIELGLCKPLTVPHCGALGPDDKDSGGASWPKSDASPNRWIEGACNTGHEGGTPPKRQCLYSSEKIKDAHWGTITGGCNDMPDYWPGSPNYGKYCGDYQSCYAYITRNYWAQEWKTGEWDWILPGNSKGRSNHCQYLYYGLNEETLKICRFKNAMTLSGRVDVILPVFLSIKNLPTW